MHAKALACPAEERRQLGKLVFYNIPMLVGLGLKPSDYQKVECNANPQSCFLFNLFFFCIKISHTINANWNKKFSGRRQKINFKIIYFY